MKINNTSKNKNNNIRIKYALVALLLLIITAFVYFLLIDNSFFNSNSTNQTDNSSIDLNPPTEEQKQAGEDIKKDAIDSENTNNDLGLSFSSITQNTDLLQIRAAISGSVSNSGACTLNLQKDDQSFEFIESTFALSSYSTCQGFDIDKSELSLGEWNLSLSVRIDDKTSSINKIITLE